MKATSLFATSLRLDPLVDALFMYLPLLLAQHELLYFPG